MMTIRFPLSRRQAEDLVYERGIHIYHDAVRFRWSRFGPLFTTQIRQRRMQALRAVPSGRWHPEETFPEDQWEGVLSLAGGDREGKVLEAYTINRRQLIRTALKEKGDRFAFV